MRLRFFTLLYVVLLTLPLMAQRPQYQKMSPMVRQLARAQKKATPETGLFFIRILDEADKVLSANGCRSLAQAGNIHIAAIPLDRLTSLSRDQRVARIEANRLCEPLLDSSAIHVHADPVYAGQNLPQAYTGKGVVVGLMDVGYDLTHPTFYSRDTTDYRIRAFWDMLSPDTIGSQLYVGRDYTTASDILALGCCRDGYEQSHGTHTLGIAAGSGYNSNYRGMAPESDICIVANAVSADSIFIDPKDYYKFTYATDALGFKYIFDYAKKENKPCVISFSEGSHQDLWGDDQLYYEMLDNLVGPGRILVVAAGNQGRVKSYFHKPVGQSSMGTFLSNNKREHLVTMKSAEDFTLQLTAYPNGTNHPDTLAIRVQQSFEYEDSLMATPFSIDEGRHQYTIQLAAYPSCYSKDEMVYDLLITADESINQFPIALEVMGSEANVEVYQQYGTFVENSLNPLLNAGEYTHGILSPGSAPSAICVGNNAYRTGFYNYAGKWIAFDGTQNGLISPYSSVGPTYDERIKPDVVAPGINIISAYSSYFLEKISDPAYMSWCVSLFDFNGRTYAWRADSGTSMSCPTVAGAIALWLEAKPDLTREEIMGVLERTCRKPDPSLSYPNIWYGYGEIDVYAGLLDILGLNRIEDISRHQSAARFNLADGQLHVTLPSETSVPLRLRLYTMNGRLIVDRQLAAHQKTYTVTLGHLNHGVYAVQIDGAKDIQGSCLIRH